MEAGSALNQWTALGSNKIRFYPIFQTTWNFVQLYQSLYHPPAIRGCFTIFCRAAFTVAKALFTFSICGVITHKSARSQFSFAERRRESQSTRCDTYDTAQIQHLVDSVSIKPSIFSLLSAFHGLGCVLRTLDGLRSIWSKLYKSNGAIYRTYLQIVCVTNRIFVLVLEKLCNKKFEKNKQNQWRSWIWDRQKPGYC